ncbi:MAG TPA: TspO/MBR family protein [Candidatus Nitrosotenuis sp.]|nr:TspO/MBR family protein [Candidatus Nitrosotenuis sp.]
MEDGSYVKNFLKLVASQAVTFFGGWVSTLANTAYAYAWYNSLIKPSFYPQRWMFFPIWAVSYFLMAYSLYLIWIDTEHKELKANAFAAFACQLILSTTWIYVFFGLNAPEPAISIIIAKLIALGITIKIFLPISKLAAYLLLPYVVWIIFVTTLNISIVVLN